MLRVRDLISEDEFQLAAETKGGNPDKSYYDGFIKSLLGAGIKERNEAAKFLAHTVWETVGFQFMKERLSQKNMKKCKEAYPNSSGGPPFYGRGPLQLSHEYNYGDASKALYPEDTGKLLRDPDLVSNDNNVGWATAAWFWKTKVHANAKTFGSTLKVINSIECDGGPNSQNRILRFNHYKQVLECLGIDAPPDSDGYCCY